MLVFIVVVFLTLGCQAVEYEDVGCFNDKIKNRTLPELLRNFRGTIDWKNGWQSKVIRKCATLAQEKGYFYFGIQFFGECWSGPNGHRTFYMHGRSKRCSNGVGKGCGNRVYMLIGPGREQCAKGNYHTLSEKGRSITYTGNGNKCDHPLPHGIGWYRFTGKAGNIMAKSPGKKHNCNTISPGWMTGELPKGVSAQENRKVCFVTDESWDQNDCSNEATIQVKNCGHFYVYKLPASPSCVLRYCGETNLSLPVGF